MTLLSLHSNKAVFVSTVYWGSLPGTRGCSGAMAASILSLLWESGRHRPPRDCDPRVCSSRNTAPAAAVLAPPSVHRPEALRLAAGASATARRPTEKPEQARTRKEHHQRKTCEIQTHRELPEGRTGPRKSETPAELKASPSPRGPERRLLSRNAGRGLPGGRQRVLTGRKPQGYLMSGSRAEVSTPVSQTSSFRQI